MSHPGPDDLLRVPLFAGLSPEQRRAIAPRLTVVHAEAGRTLLAEGSRARTFFVLVSGRAEVTQGDRHVRTLGGGDFFGEISLALGGRRTASVTATEPCEVWALGRRSFRALSRLDPEVTAVLEATVRRRLAAG